MKRLLLSLPYGMAFRNVVCCGVIDACLRADAVVKVLIPSLAPDDHDVVIRELPQNVEVGRLESAQPSLLVKWLKLHKQYVYSKRTQLDSFELRYRYRRRKTPFFHAAVRTAERVSELMVSEAMVDRFLAIAPQPHETYYREMMRDFRPDALVITKPGYNPDDLPLIKQARAIDCPVISIDTTWDNMVAKRPPYILPDSITLWNNGMRQEALDYYGFRSESAVVTGGPQFDIFFSNDQLPSRTEFLHSLGLDPDRQLIVFTLNNDIMTPDNGAYVRMLLEAIADGRIHERPNLVVRIHPWDRRNDYTADAAGYARVYVQRPFGHPAATSVFECVPTKNDVLAYGALMRHANVLINIASTTSLDALATDTPIVNIAFDVTPNHPETSCARFYGYTHYKAIVESGAVRLAHSPEELWNLLNAYLSDRTLERHARCEARDRFLTYSDGRNAERVAAAVQAAAG